VKIRVANDVTTSHSKCGEHNEAGIQELRRQGRHNGILGCYDSSLVTWCGDAVVQCSVVKIMGVEGGRLGMYEGTHVVLHPAYCCV